MTRRKPRYTIGAIYRHVGLGELYRYDGRVPFERGGTLHRFVGVRCDTVLTHLGDGPYEAV